MIEAAIAPTVVCYRVADFDVDIVVGVIAVVVSLGKRVSTFPVNGSRDGGRNVRRIKPLRTAGVADAIADAARAPCL